MDNYSGKDDCHGERLVRIEEGIKSLARSVDRIRDDLKAHVEDEKEFQDKILDLEVHQATQDGVITGSKWMLSFVTGMAGVALYLGLKTGP